MTTLDIIYNTINDFNTRYSNQVNLASDSAMQELAKNIHEALSCATTSETYNDQQMYLFESIDQEEPK
jgi:hypothetical protein